MIHLGKEGQRMKEINNTTKVKIESPTPIEGRTYYEDIKESQEFWNQYSVYFEE